MSWTLRSGYNVNTGRLTEEMFFEALAKAARLAGV
jgi:uracil-DNA glycosylase